MKIIVILCVYMIMLASSVLAQDVTVSGNGQDKDSAIKDAMRNAVERVVGTYVDSTTLVENYRLSLDEIYTKSYGFVTNIQILDEYHDRNMYKIKALVSVNTNPNSELMNKLSMIKTLNNPRIAVVIKGESDYNNSNEKVCRYLEGCINEKLLNLGFKHILDHETVQRIGIDNYVSRIYSGYNINSHSNLSFDVDYIVIGHVNVKGDIIYLPNGNELVESMLSNGEVQLNIKIVKVDTYTVIGTFFVDGSSIGNSRDKAIDNALLSVGTETAEKVAEKFGKHAAKIDFGINMVVNCENSSLMDMFIKELRGINGVSNVTVREQLGNKVTLYVDTVLKPYNIVEIIRDRNKFGVFTDNLSSEYVQMSIFKE